MYFLNKKEEMGKLIKMYYRVNSDDNCLDDCPFGENYKCGSVSCQECKYCLGNGKEPIWILEKEKGLNFEQGYIYCSKCYKTTIGIYVMRFIQFLKAKIR